MFGPGPSIWDFANVGTRSDYVEPKRSEATEENEDESAKQNFATKAENNLEAKFFQLRHLVPTFAN